MTRPGFATVEAGDVREVLEDVEHVSWGELIRTGRSDPCLAGRLMVHMDVAPDGSFDLFRYAFPLTLTSRNSKAIF